MTTPKQQHKYPDAPNPLTKPTFSPPPQTTSCYNARYRDQDQYYRRRPQKLRQGIFQGNVNDR